MQAPPLELLPTLEALLLLPELLMLLEPPVPAELLALSLGLLAPALELLASLPLSEVRVPLDPPLPPLPIGEPDGVLLQPLTSADDGNARRTTKTVKERIAIGLVALVELSVEQESSHHARGAHPRHRGSRTPRFGL